MSYLLDTNVLSEIRKPNPNAGVKAWFDSVAPNELFLSTLVVGEIRRGIEEVRRTDPQKAALYEGWLDLLRAEYSDRLLPVSSDVADRWGHLDVPNPLPAIDGLIAATALIHDLTLVTQNTSDVARTSVRILNPFS